MTAPKFITMKGSSHLTDKPFYVGLVQHESVMTRKEIFGVRPRNFLIPVLLSPRHR